MLWYHWAMAEEIREMTLRLPAAVHKRLHGLAYDNHTSINAIVVGWTIEGLERLDAAGNKEK